jgi:hypothetical protein
MQCDLEVLIRLSLILAPSTPGRQANSPLFELARVLVRFDHVASRIVNANHSIKLDRQKP